jgi:hypothetical protein
VPPVLLDTEVAREVCGGAALYVAKNDIAGPQRPDQAALRRGQPRSACCAPLRGTCAVFVEHALPLRHSPRWSRRREHARHRDRQPQHQERSGELPSVAARPSSSRAARDRRGRQRVP